MAIYYPGDQHEISFTNPDAAGDNVTGLTWTLKVFIKDNVKVTSGTEYSSITCVAVGNDFYRVRFTPDDDSTSVYVIAFVSDAVVPDYFEEIYEPDWEKIYLEADMEHDTTSPETVIYLLPGGATLSEFQLSRTGTVLSREKQ